MLPMFAIITCWLVFTTDPETQRHTIEYLEYTLRQMQDPEFRSEMIAEFELTFGSATVETLGMLQNEANPSIAIRAAWEPVRRSFPLLAVNESAIVNHGCMQRFCGFVEGRLNCNVPDWWERNAEEMSDLLFFPVEELGVSILDGEQSVFVPNGFDITFSEDSVLFVNGNNRCRVPCTLIQNRRLLHSVAAQFHNGCLFCAFLKDSPYQYELHCVDCETETVLWSADVWAGLIRGSSGPESRHSMEIVVTESTTLVFGMAPSVAYIEGFDLQSGALVFRFSTKWWWSI
jgi:hypothetical protein